MYILKAAYNIATHKERRCVDASASTCYERYHWRDALSATDFICRSDLKLMRQDGIAGVLAVDRLLKDVAWEQRTDMSLFVASGAFIEGSDSHYKKMARICSAFETNQKLDNMLLRMFKATPPLLALETLTNSSMSFISKYNGVKGHNTTLGNDLMSAVYALDSIQNAHKSNPAVLVSTNCGGDYSFISNMDLVNNPEDWQEGSGAACLLIQQSKSVDHVPIAEITGIEHKKSIPSISTKPLESNWFDLLKDCDADIILHTGAYTTNQYREDTKALKRLEKPVKSHFEHFGNMGATSIFYNIIEASELLQEGYQRVDIITRDLFGREALIKIKNYER